MIWSVSARVIKPLQAHLVQCQKHAQEGLKRCAGHHTGTRLHHRTHGLQCKTFVFLHWQERMCCIILCYVPDKVIVWSLCVVIASTGMQNRTFVRFSVLCKGAIATYKGLLLCHVCEMQ